MPKLKDINFDGKEFSIHYITGKVVNTSKHTSTQTYTTGGGYDSQRQQYRPTEVNTTTTLHTQIFLVDNNDQEHSVQVNNFNIACREGNELSMVWVIKQGSSEGPYVLAYNHSTNQSFVKDTAIGPLVLARDMATGCIPYLAVLLGLGGGIFSMIIGMLFDEFFGSLFRVSMILFGLALIAGGVMVPVRFLRNRKNKFLKFKALLLNSVKYSDLKN